MFSSLLIRAKRLCCLQDISFRSASRELCSAETPAVAARVIVSNQRIALDSHAHNEHERIWKKKDPARPQCADGRKLYIASEIRRDACEQSRQRRQQLLQEQPQPKFLIRNRSLPVQAS